MGSAAVDTTTTYKISVPVGCTMRLLCDMCNRATSADSMKEFESFRTVSRSVGTDKCHFFERLGLPVS